MNKSKIIFRLGIIFLIIIELCLVFISLFVNLNEEEQLNELEVEAFLLNKNDPLIDTIVSHMSIDEKIGQLFLVKLNDAKSENKENIDSLMHKYNISGVIFEKTQVLDQLIISNYLESRSLLPLFIGSNGSIINQANCSLPIDKIINSVNDGNFADKYIKKIGEILKEESVNIEFSNNINTLDSKTSSTGFSHKDSIVAHQSSYIRNILHSNKIISCFNFNDSLFFSKDSLAIDTLSRMINSKFKIKNYLAMKMPEMVMKQVLSKQVRYNFADFYDQNYGFSGLILTPIQKGTNLNDLKLLFESGAELFITNEFNEKHIEKIKALVKSHEIKESDIDKRLKRILAAKKWTVPKYKKLKSAEISLSKIMNKKVILTSWNLHKNSICVIKNSKRIIPFTNLLNKNHLIVFNESNFLKFNNTLDYYMDYSEQVISNKKSLNNKKIKNAKNIIIAIGDNQKISSKTLKELKKINKRKNLIVICFGTNYKKFLFADVLLYAYNDHDLSQINMAQVLAGTLRPIGKPPYKELISKMLNPKYSKINRLRHTIPEAAGFDNYKLKSLDTLIQNAIYNGATPGAQILAAKNGKVFLYKSYGYQTYAQKRKVKNSDLYDIASITKVAATTLASMKLFETGKISLTDSIKNFIDDSLECTFRNHQLGDFFLHKTGLQAFMPVLQYISYRNKLTKRYDKYYSEKKDSTHTVEIAKNYYLRRDYLDSITTDLYKLEVDTTKEYKYSDANFNIIYDILLKKINVPYTDFLENNIYNPLQLRHTDFLPLKRFNKSQIAPTQEDVFWRKQLVHGTVHDESAALYGGVAGNAGLFSNANDLAIIFQMLLNGGTYGNAKVFKASTISYFTTAPADSRRAYGFSIKNGGAFGHTGFTGCVVWANPESNFIFVFLSNSIHPEASNKKLRKMKIREKAYNIILQSLSK